MHKFKPRKVDKRWGYELWLANNEDHDYCGKILHINEGGRSSMHFHLNKHETFYVLKGKLRIDLIDTISGDKFAREVCEGESFEVPQGQPHQLFAYNESVEFVEISTFHDDADSKRVWR